MDLFLAFQSVCLFVLFLVAVRTPSAVLNESGGSSVLALSPILHYQEV